LRERERSAIARYFSRPRPFPITKGAMVCTADGGSEGEAETTTATTDLRQCDDSPKKRRLEFGVGQAGAERSMASPPPTPPSQGGPGPSGGGRQLATVSPEKSPENRNELERKRRRAQKNLILDMKEMMPFFQRQFGDASGVPFHLNEQNQNGTPIREMNLLQVLASVTACMARIKQDIEEGKITVRRN